MPTLVPSAESHCTLLTAGAPIEEVGGHLPFALHLDHPSTLQFVALGSENLV